MIYLASSSPTRAKILKENGIEFTQIPVNFDESKIAKTCYMSYSYKVAQAKKEQFFKIYGSKYDNVLFADSSVICSGKILGKAKNDEEAREMLNLQSGNKAGVISALIFVSREKIIENISISIFHFAKFPFEEIEKYIADGEYKGKAGAMMIEGFNKKFIIDQSGETYTAMGLNVEILKRYLW